VQDKLTLEEYQRVKVHFSQEPMWALFVCMLYDDFARPQELCYINLDDIELFEFHARIKINEHSKERPKVIQIIEGVDYLIDWLAMHPLKYKGIHDAPLFINPKNINKRLTVDYANAYFSREIPKTGLNKKIRCYSFKRNGISHALLRGEPEQDIQKRAGWTSTKPLRHYDQTNQQDFHEKELREKGIQRIRDLRKEGKLSDMDEMKKEINEINKKLSLLLTSE